MKLVPVEEEFAEKVKENVRKKTLKAVTELTTMQTPYGGWILEFTDGSGMIVPGTLQEYLGEATLNIIMKAPRAEM